MTLSTEGLRLLRPERFHRAMVRRAAPAEPVIHRAISVEHFAEQMHAFDAMRVINRRA